ncbi:FG-GAP-like repeat-containing protein [Streptomyces sp. NBC_00234]|uniref:FG-GAP-like repeat-containing protein n=1 Tax=Streptomyces sp. NBC_00234 TaxID=2903638 RepID=UPI002E27C1EC|nr:FG-GAP-like repeat-containing protein [Streptomyces sp. NBC_00234]
MTPKGVRGRGDGPSAERPGGAGARRGRRLLLLAVAGAVLASGLLSTGSPKAEAAEPVVPSWVIPLYYEDVASGIHRACTGIVLSRTKTLATPDCVTGMDESDFDWDYDLRTGQLSGGGNMTAYHSHPQYSATSRRAALTVTTRRTVDSSGKPALASAADAALWAPGAKAVFHSWSGLDLDSAPRVRHSEQVVVTSWSQCSSLLGRFVPRETLCTVPAPGAPPVADEDRCFGDAGGALVAGGKLIAVSATRATGCASGGVRLYTRIASYRQLVDEWTRDTDSDYRFPGSVLATESNGLVDVCTTTSDRKLWGCYTDSTGAFDGFGYASYLQAGDMNGDGFGDLLARTSGGTLYRVPSTEMEPADFKHRVSLGTGWNAYNPLVAVRDFSGDGRNDVVGRDKAGVLWLFRGTSDGKLAARTRISSGWNQYTALTGRGDLTGDGRSDLVARDKAGVLWMYPGDARRQYPVRTRIGSGWNQFNAIVASGDMDHDGRQDILARTPAGAVYLYNADHNGGFKAPRKLASTRWQKYVRIS